MTRARETRAERAEGAPLFDSIFPIILPKAMDDEAPPSKRMRRCQSILSEHHADLYFEDGNIVISAISANRSISDLVYFRVHKSLLSFHSPFFKDMFSMPTPECESMHDGVVLLHSQDEAEDMASFLRVLYNPL
jgi:hypothetical protein